MGLLLEARRGHVPFDVAARYDADAVKKAVAAFITQHKARCAR